jgi:hypothetical protein
MTVQGNYPPPEAENEGQLKFADNNSLSLNVEIILSLTVAKCKQGVGLNQERGCAGRMARDCLPRCYTIRYTLVGRTALRLNRRNRAPTGRILYKP